MIGEDARVSGAEDAQADVRMLVQPAGDLVGDGAQLLVFDFEDGHCDRFARVLAPQRYAASVVCFLPGLDV